MDDSRQLLEDFIKDMSGYSNAITGNVPSQVQDALELTSHEFSQKISEYDPGVATEQLLNDKYALVTTATLFAVCLGAVRDGVTTTLLESFVASVAALYTLAYDAGWRAALN